MQGFVPHLYQKLLNNTVKIFSFIEFFMPAIEIFLRRNFLLHFQHFLFQPILALQEGKSNSFWIRLRREGSEGSEGSKGSEGKVLKIDGPSAQGFLSLTAFQAEGCGLPLCGNAYKVGVTGIPSRPHLRAVCIECASRPKLALSLHIKGPSFYLADRPF